MFYSQLCLDSNIENITEVEEFIDHLLQKCNIEEQYRALISVPLIEGTKNAIVHGNCCDKSKKVTIAMQINNAKMHFSIADEGQGFDFEKILQQSILERKGNGLLLIEKLATNIQFDDNGSKISFVIDVPFSIVDNQKRINILNQIQNQEIKQKHLI